MSTLAARLTDPEHAGPCLLPCDTEVLCEAARRARLRVVRIDLAAVQGKRDLLAILAAALHFPEWFGGNWDALEDCLSDMDREAGRGHAIVFENAGRFAAGAPQDFSTAVDIFTSVAAFRRTQGQAFWTFFTGLPGPVAGVRAAI